jgi:hypothetical protein
MQILTTVLSHLEPNYKDTETIAKYNAMLKRRFKIWPAVAQKAAARRQAIDLDELHAPWFQAKKKEYSNKLSRKYPEAFKQADAVWADETQVSANENDIEEQHDFSPGNHGITTDDTGRNRRFCKTSHCTSSHPRHHLLTTERLLYGIYLLKTDSSSYQLSFHQFRICRPYYVVLPGQKTHVHLPPEVQPRNG